jgi:enolase
MAKIKTIEASEILNAKGLPAIQVVVTLSDGKIGIASCPTGEKIGHYEAVNLEENQGVSKAISNIKTIISPQLINQEAKHQSEIDKIMIELDGTQNKSRLGANATLALSMAVAKAEAESSGLPLYLYLRQFVKDDHGALKIPTPIFNFIGGGNKEKRFANFFEFLVIPAAAKPYLECIRIGEIIQKSLKTLIETKYAKKLDDYEEGFTPELTSNKEGFALIQQAIATTPAKLGLDVFLGLDSRASLFFKEGEYNIKDVSTPLSSKDLVDFYKQLNEEIHLLYLEDALDQDDWDGWAYLFQKLSATTMIAGGDLISTNPYRLQMAKDKKAVNTIVIKPNQIGTVIESLAIAEAARETGLKIVVSHRSNETNDDFLADFSVAIAADYIKIGSLSRGENVAKYNRLLEIENQLKIL